MRLVPDEFFNFVAKEARTANPDIRIYGECFHGFLDSAQKICRTTCISIPNLTGYLVMNAGYVNSNIDFAADERYSGMIENFKSFDNIGEVVGFAPYYKSMQDARLTKEQQYECKKRVISRFAEKNMSTITYLNDGCDDHLAEHYGTTDNLIYDTTTLQEK